MPTLRILTLTQLTLLATLLSACQASDTGQTSPPVAPQGQAQPASAPTSSEQGINTMSALDRLLATYASTTPPTWAAFDGVEGIDWTDAAAIENPDAGPEYRFSRSGKLLLSGFAENDLPNGKAGADADYVRGNEGESGVTLSGTADQVTSIAVQKFYADADYRKVLQAQIGDKGSVRAIAAACQLAEGTTAAEANFARNEFFELSLADGAKLFAEGTVDEEGAKYSPGSTTYLFYKEEPTKRIDSMQCKRS
jgi:hypothetical protein